MTLKLKPYAVGVLALLFVVAIHSVVPRSLSPDAPFLFLIFAPLLASLCGGAVPGVVLLILAAVVGDVLYLPPFQAQVLHLHTLSVLWLYFFQAGIAVTVGAIVFRFRRRQGIDTAARAETQAALLKSEMRYRSLAAATSSIVWTADACGNFADPQHSWEAFTGQTWEEHRGKGWVSALHPDDRPRIVHDVKDASMSGAMLSTEGRIWDNARHDFRYFETRGVPIVSGGVVVEWIGALIDVHDQKVAALELKKAKEAAEAANQAKTQFLANMSHEIRTPLSVISGFSDLILQVQPDGEVGGHGRVIKRNADQLSRLVDEVLDVSKVEADRLDLELVPFSLPALLEDVTELLAFKAREKGLLLAVESVGAIPPRIVSDPQRIRQILLNVIGNAIKFTSSGRIDVKVRSYANNLEFLVNDTGIGLSAVQRERLFKPFSQADDSITRKFGGTGLGLYLSRKLANLMGGDCSIVESQPGKGSTFRVVLKVSSEDLAAERESSAKADDVERSARTLGALRNVHVLLAEDAADNQILVSRLLLTAGASVDTAVDGIDAMNKALGGNYDVVLMDVQMPNLDGLEATRRLRGAGYAKPIIALTAFAMKSDRDRCLDAGCSDYLSKPVDNQRLIEKIAGFVH